MKALFIYRRLIPMVLLPDERTRVLKVAKKRLKNVTCKNENTQKI